MRAARQRDVRAAADDAQRPLRALQAGRAACDPAAWGVGLVTGAPAAGDSVASACAAAPPEPVGPPPASR